ncbi:MAG TPA: ISAs1 family transposase [Phycisphaerae bacterium]|nr:ISAs1 family transposase [Phycisphaerae bacterium]
MDAPVTGEILRVFVQLPDPRGQNVRHRLMDILTIALCGVICGAGDWVAVVFYANKKKAWLESFLELPNGIPSHDTFSRVFATLNPEELEKCFVAWMSKMVQLGGGKLVAIDGKSLRRSFEHAWDKSGMAHMVSAFVEANRMVFSQIACDGKGQELDAIEKLLKLLDLEGSVVTIDALGCQVSIAELIVQAKADYLLQVKDNQPTLCAKIQTLLAEAVLENLEGWKGDSFQETTGDHGRIETRKVWVTWEVKHLGELAKTWPGLKSVALVERTRQVGEEVTIKKHYYISTLDARKSARQFLEYSRGHWSVENNLHWQLDVNFDEDQRRIRKGHGAENFSRLCRIALNLLKNEKTAKCGIKTKRLGCGWENDYLLKVITG